MNHLSRHHSAWLLDGMYFREPPKPDSLIDSARHMVDSVVSLHVDSLNEEDGLTRRLPIGNAFAVSMKEDEETFRYLVSTREVIRRSIPHGNIFVRFILDRDDCLDVATAPCDSWYPHPDPLANIAIHPLDELPDSVNLTSVSMDGSMVSDTSSGDSLFSCGRFDPQRINDRSLKPVVSFGKVSKYPELVKTGLMGPDSKPIDVEGFMTQWSIWGGAAGSPVFRYSLDSIDESKVLFIGLIHSHLSASDSQAMGEILENGLQTAESETAVVVPAWRITEALQEGPLADDRGQNRKHMLNSLTEDDTQTEDSTEFLEEVLSV